MKIYKPKAFTPDTNFIGATPNGVAYTPVLVGQYYWTGAYIFYFPDVSNLDVPTYGYQVKNNEAWSFTTRCNWLHADQSTLQQAFITAVNNGQTWERLTDGKYSIPVIQHGKKNYWVDEVPNTHNQISSVSISASSSSATVGTAFTDTFTTTCNQPDDGSYSYQWTATGATGGLTLDNTTIANPTISGTPTTAGNLELSVTVTNSFNNKATSSVDVSVIAAAPVISSCSISPATATATVGSAFSQVFTLTGNPADAVDHYQWNNISGAATAGLTLTKGTNTATVSGTPTTAGGFTVNGFAYDSYGHYKSATATVTVNAAPVVLTASISPTVSNDYTTGVSSKDTCTVTTNATTPNYVWSVYIDGAKDSTQTAALTGQGTATASLTLNAGKVHSNCWFQCDVTDSATGQSATVKSTFNIVAAPVETGTLVPANCSLEQLPAYTAKKAGWVEYTVTVDEADDGTYQYYWYANGNGTGLGNVQSESGASITNTWVKGAGTVKIGGTSYNKAGTVYYSVKVKDTHGNEYDSKQLNWTIQ